MSLTFLLIAANLLISGLAAFGLIKRQRSGGGFICGALVLLILPLANVSFLVFLLKGIPYFSISSLSGIIFVTLTSVAIICAICAAIWPSNKAETK